MEVQPAGCDRGPDVNVSRALVQVVVTDVRKPDQLLALACRCNLILNCVGPYRHSGENVVAACVTAGTDYLDVSGEPGMFSFPFSSIPPICQAESMSCFKGLLYEYLLHDA